MTVTYDQVNRIFKTLPVSYYLKHNIKTELSETSNTSFIDIMNDKITIAYPNVVTCVSTLESNDHLEMIIRSILYHEISHAILTPKTMIPTNWLNVFEDERIETLLRGYYMNINFRKAVKLLNNFTEGEIPHSGWDLYYQIVRYRIGPSHFLRRVKQIINTYNNLTCDITCDTVDAVYDYKRDVRYLYEDILEYYDLHKPEEKAKETKETDGSDESTESTNAFIDSDKVDEFDKSDDSKETRPIHPEESEEPETESLDKSEIEKTISSVTKKYDNSKFDTKVNIAFSNIMKKNRHNGSSINAYSGKFDPRSTIRDDYKFFTTQNRLGHLKTNSKIKLNLFIDRSGSFCGSQDIVNQLLKSLATFEKLNPDFNFDLITIGMFEKLHDKSDRILEATGGNAITPRLLDITQKVQSSTATNINLVLFDGDALTDCDRDCAKYFSAFNSKSFKIISDYDNERYFTANCPNAKATYTYKYTEELIKNVFEILEHIA